MFGVKVVPGSSVTALAGVLGDLLKIKVAAPPEKGKANKNLIEFLSKQLGIKRNQISILSGQINPVKKIKITGISTETLLEKLKV